MKNKRVSPWFQLCAEWSRRRPDARLKAMGAWSSGPPVEMPGPRSKIRHAGGAQAAAPKAPPRGRGVAEDVHAGFTLLELLTVLAIIGILAAIAAPTLNSFKPNITAAATRQLLDDVARARQLALSQRTTVYMVFIEPEFWKDPTFQGLPPVEQNKANPLLDKQLTGYTFVTLRTLGDQPGRGTPRYLSPWKTLPDGAFIPLWKFLPNNTPFDIYTNSPSGSVLAFRLYGFDRTTMVPFPSAETLPSGHGFPQLPYIAFDYMGRLTCGRNVSIPLAKGSVLYSRDPATRVATKSQPSAMEVPPGNSTNSFTLINIDWVTGRAHVERQEVQ